MEVDLCPLIKKLNSIAKLLFKEIFLNNSIVLFLWNVIKVKKFTIKYPEKRRTLY